MYPHERSLVKRLADKPFTLLGINSDANKKQLKQEASEWARISAAMSSALESI